MKRTMTKKNILRVGWIVASILMPVSTQAINADEKSDAPAERKTYSFVGKIKEVHIVSDSQKTSVLFEIESGNILLDTFRILFDKGEAQRSWWMTKGMFSIALPKEGLMLKDIPEKNSPVDIVFDHDVPKNSTDIEEITLLSIQNRKDSTPIDDK